MLKIRFKVLPIFSWELDAGPGRPGSDNDSDDDNDNDDDQDISPYATFHLLGMREEAKRQAEAAGMMQGQSRQHNDNNDDNDSDNDDDNDNDNDNA